MAWWYDLSRVWTGTPERRWDLVVVEADDAEQAEIAMEEQTTEVLSGQGPRGPFETREEAEQAARDEEDAADWIGIF